MTSVTIYGASDDLIEVEGATEEEFNVDTSGGTVLVVGPNSSVARVHVWMDDEGDWQAAIKAVRGNFKQEVVPRSTTHPADQAAKITYHGDGPVNAYLLA